TTMRDPARARREAEFEQLLEELREDPAAAGGDWLARLVGLVRPRRGEAAVAAESRFRDLLRLLQARPELAAALGACLAAQLTSRMHRILYADSGALASQGFV